MNSIGMTPPVLRPIQSVPAPASQDAPALPLPHADNTDTAGAAADASVDVVAAQQKRYQAVQRQAQAIANIYVVSDTKFTIFKDSTGQYITRFTSLRDGKVTYIPEPTLFKLNSSAADVAPTVQIKA